MSKITLHRSRQRGMGMLGFIVIIGLVAFFATVALKVGPLYMDFWTLKTIMDEIKANPQQVEGGGNGILRAIDRRLNINSVYGHSSKDFKVKKLDQGNYLLTLEYEARTHLFFNLDAVAIFHREVEMKLK